MIIAIRTKPNFAEVYYYRGIVKGELKQYKEAIADFDTTIRLKPDSAQAYYNRGLTKSRLGQISKGKQDILTALKLAEQSGDVRLRHISNYSFKRFGRLCYVVGFYCYNK